MAIDPSTSTIPSSSSDEYSQLSTLLLNKSGKTSLAQRFRALFALKGLATTQSIQIIGQALSPIDPKTGQTEKDGGEKSALLGHELAYCLGQIASPEAIPILKRVLEDGEVHPMVRHEAAEALSAISQPSSQILPILIHYSNPSNEKQISVRETCEIGVEKVKWDDKMRERLKNEGLNGGEEGRKEGRKMTEGEGEEEDEEWTGRSIFSTIDPAPPLPLSSNPPNPNPNPNPNPETKTSINHFRSLLLNDQSSLFERYRAMFALRDIAASAQGNVKLKLREKEAVEALAEGFTDGSALFRHEIAYIFGQLTSPYSIPSLLKVLRNRSEDEMVRHEAAEALGSLGGEIDEEKQDEGLEEEETKNGVTVNGKGGGEEKFLVDGKGVWEWLMMYSGRRKAINGDELLEEIPQVVRESCEVALDMYEYEQSGELHYATNLEALPTTTTPNGVASTQQQQQPIAATA